MFRISRAATIVFAFAFAPAADAVCSCQCMNGEPRTLCTNFAEAATQHDLCGAAPLRVACPPAAGTVEQPLDAPREDVHGCRTSMLWDASTGTYATPVKVCETRAPAVRGTGP